MTRKENIRAILKCYFTGFKDVMIDSACERICELEQEPTAEKSVQDMTELEKALLHIKTRADAWAVKVVKDALSKEPCEVSEYDKDHIWYKGGQYISLRRFLEVKAEAEKEPCTDAVSREAVIKAITNTSGIRGDALNALYALPSVNPQPICEEREKGECPYYAG